MNNIKQKESIDIDDNINKDKRKYNSIFREKVSSRVKKVKDKKFLIKIFNILNKELKNNYTENNNGIFFNINKLSNGSIEKIIKILDQYSLNNLKSELKIDYSQYSVDNNSSLSEFSKHRLSNKEKNILKKKLDN